MFTCAGCGLPGACKCDATDENGLAAGEWFHPLCFAKKGTDSDHDYFKPLRRPVRHGLSKQASSALRQVRVENRRGLQRQSLTMYGLQARSRRVF